MHLIIEEKKYDSVAHSV